MRVLILILFISQAVFAQDTGFIKFQQLHNYVKDGPQDIKVMDYDGDGDQDVLFFNDTRIGWYENMGDQFFKQAETILETKKYDFKFFMEDFDGDNDWDFLIANKIHNNAIFYINNGSAYETHTIIKGLSNENVGQYYEFPIVVKDLNSDGKLDLISIKTVEDNCQNMVVLMNNIVQDEFSFSTSQTINTCYEVYKGPTSILLFDINGDLKLDIIAPSFKANHSHPTTTFYYLQDANGRFLPGIEINTRGRNIFFKDSDDDGDKDGIIEYVTGSYGWLENLDGVNFESFDKAEHIFYLADQPEWLEFEDIDNDGVADLKYTGRDKAYFAKINNDGSVTQKQLSYRENSFWWSYKLQDINGDQLDDFIGFSNRTNDPVQLSFVPLNNSLEPIGHDFVIAADPPEDPIRSLTYDVNNDNYLDVIVLTKSRLSVFLQSPIRSFHEVIIDYHENEGSDLKLADLTGDGFQDLVLNGRWLFENDPENIFKSRMPFMVNENGEPIDINPKKLNVPSFEIGDVDSDGDLDVVCGQCDDDNWYTVIYFNNGKNIFSDSTELYMEGLNKVLLYDVDDDNDLDIIGASYRLITYFENIDGVFNSDRSKLRESIKSFGQPIVDLEIKDLNKNGYPEIVFGTVENDWKSGITYSKYGLIRDLQPDLSHEYQLISNNFRISDIHLVDLNNDGFEDIVTVNSGSKISWQLNNQNAVFYNSVHVETDFSGRISFGDINNDGFQDMITTSAATDRIFYYKNQIFDTPVNLEMDEIESPKSIVLEQNYPNPFNPSTIISFSLDKPDFVELTVFNSVGQKISTLLNRKMPAGNHSQLFDATNLSSGIYLYRLESGDIRLTKKMSLLK